MQIWVDADACPVAIKEILYRAAERVELPLVLVANRELRTPWSPFIRSVRVPHGFDVADGYIVQHARSGDIVITADIPLAAEVLEKGAHVLDPRGERYSEENIGDRLATRNLLAGLRDDGMISGGPAGFGLKERQAFANQLDRLLAQRPTETD